MMSNELGSSVETAYGCQCSKLLITSSVLMDCGACFNMSASQAIQHSACAHSWLILAA